MITNIRKIGDQVYHVEFGDGYDMAWFFLRVQEHSENISQDIYGKPFLILDFIHWYSATHGNGSFSYTKDFAGFNVPSTAIHRLYSKKNYKTIRDPNKFDKTMYWLHHFLMSIQNGKEYYLIGAQDSETLEHELAHAMYWTDSSYKKKMDKFLSDTSNEFFLKLKHILNDMGYNDAVVMNEAQAYLSTGLAEGMQKEFAEKKLGAYVKRLQKKMRSYFLGKYKELLDGSA